MKGHGKGSVQGDMDVIYHIVEQAVWKEAVVGTHYMPSSLATSGFIHCSTAEQVVRVANNLFRGRNGLLLLHIDVKQLSAPVVYENLDGGPELFPHVYGPIEVSAVRAATPFEPGDDGLFNHHAEAVRNREVD